MKCKKIIVNGIKDVNIIESELDESNLKPTECLIETYVTMISPGTELSRVFGLKKGASYPVEPGYCNVGKILKKGSDVWQANVGDVVLSRGTHCNYQIYDYAKKGDFLYKLDEKTSYDEGVFLGMCEIAMNGIYPVDVKLGDTCVIIGLGMLGIVLSLLYKKMGINVIATDPVFQRCELAKDMGIENVVCCSPEQQLDVLKKTLNNNGADIVVDASGFSSSVELAIQLAAKSGQVVLMGSPRVEYITDVTPIFNAIHMKMLNVVGALNQRYNFEAKKGSRLSQRRAIEVMEKMLQKKEIDCARFISHHIIPTNEEVMKAYDGLTNHKGEYTGVVINWK